jgi:hypothetical protein
LLHDSLATDALGREPQWLDASAGGSRLLPSYPRSFSLAVRPRQWLQSFKEFPIRQKPASFNLDEVMRKLSPTQ